jgi:iron complex outermembrane receptor protein
VAPLGAQQPTGTIRGRISDAGTQQPISGVHVTFGTRGVVSQPDGRFVLAGVPASTDSLRARIIGYAPAAQLVAVAGGDTVTVDFAMAAQAVALSELVVVGYGEQRAGNIPGAVKQVTSAEFNTGRIVTPQQLIQSKVAGVQVVDNNEPGGGIAVRIRGATSINASSEPLYVVDGVPVGTGAGGVFSRPRSAQLSQPGRHREYHGAPGRPSAAIYGANAANAS